MAHRLKPKGYAEIQRAGSYFLIGFLKTDASGRAAPLHPVGGKRTEALNILPHDACHQLTGEMIREIGSLGPAPAGSQYLKKFTIREIEVFHHLVGRFFDHRGKG